MPTYEVEHRWPNTPSPTSLDRMKQIATLVKNGQVPNGCRPISIVTPPGMSEVRSVWEAPDEASLEAFYKKHGFDSNRTIRRVEPLFVA